MSRVPANAERADALLRAGRFVEAAAILRKLASASPHNASYQRAYASALGRAGKPEDARAMLRRALRTSPRNHELLCELALISLALGDAPGAEQASARAMDARAGDVNVRMVRAMALRAVGRDDEAYDLVAPAVLAGSAHGPTVQVFMELCLWRDDPGPGIDAGRRVLDAGGAGAFNERRVRLAYGQLLERAGRYDDAFRQFELVNRMAGGAAGFDPDAFDGMIDRVCEAWTPGALDQASTPAPDAGPEARPVFIVGMPRSGSSLVERVLDRHPEVAAGGEMDAMHRAVIEAVPGSALAEEGGLVAVAEADLLARRAERLRRSYTRSLRKRSLAAPRVTDKALTNFLHLGPIRAALPGASVLHCVRDPLDTCLSCYLQDFASPMPFTRDLRVLGRFYNAYRRLMRHWEQVAPPPPTIAVYERVVDDLEGEAHRLVDAVDLPWVDACARPHEGGGYTATASRDQVRRRVYRDSVGRWKRYERHLGPLLETLDPAYLE